jgi:hypothetical protein
MPRFVILDLPMWRGRPRPRNADTKTTRKENLGCRTVFIVLALSAALSPCAAAQRAPRGSFAFRHSPHPSRFSRPSPYLSLPFPFLSDAFNLEDLYSSGYPIASQPPVVFLQAAHALSGTADISSRSESRDPSSIQPLMFELQNGRYVRVTDTAAESYALPLSLAPPSQPVSQSHRNPVRSSSSNSASQTLASTAAMPAPNLPPAVLVFKDGHTEEVRDYTIADGMLYARGDFYTDGYWNRKIDLSTLNLAETLQANRSRNVKFTLPSSPNEVIAHF